MIWLQSVFSGEDRFRVEDVSIELNGIDEGFESTSSSGGCKSHGE